MHATSKGRPQTGVASGFNENHLTGSATTDFGSKRTGAIINANRIACPLDVTSISSSPIAHEVPAILGGPATRAKHPGWNHDGGSSIWNPTHGTGHLVSINASLMGETSQHVLHHKPQSKACLHRVIHCLVELWRIGKAHGVDGSPGMMN